MPDVQFERIEIEHPAIHRLVAEMSVLDNTRILVGCFSVISADQSVWYSRGTPTGDLRDFGPLLHSPELQAALPELQTQEPLLCDPEWEPISHLTLDGYIADRLIQGGTFSDYEGTVREA